MAPSNTLSIWGNEKTMNLNTLILTNIQSSPYFKVQLFELKTFHEVIDEIYYKVDHIEPWERGSRKTSGQTGMCGGVRGVGAGGIVSSAFCLLYKLYTLKLTRKQVNNLINHADSPYIRALGFMYIRFTQPPQDLWEWFAEYLDDEEEIDVKAGGGHTVTIGNMLRMWLVKLDWYATLFPRIPVPVQKFITQKLMENPSVRPGKQNFEEEEEQPPPSRIAANDDGWGEAGRAGRSNRSSPAERGRDSRGHGHGAGDISRGIQREKDRQDDRNQSKDRHHSHSRHRSRSRDRIRRSHSKDRSKRRSRSRERPSSKSHEHRGDRHKRSRSRERRRSQSRDRHRHKEHSKHRSRSRERHSKHRSRSRDRERHSKHKSKSDGHGRDSFERDLYREKKRQQSNGDFD